MAKFLIAFLFLFVSVKAVVALPLKSILNPYETTVYLGIGKGIPESSRIKNLTGNRLLADIKFNADSINHERRVLALYQAQTITAPRKRESNNVKTGIEWRYLSGLTLGLSLKYNQGIISNIYSSSLDLILDSNIPLYLLSSGLFATTSTGEVKQQSFCNTFTRFCNGIGPGIPDLLTLQPQTETLTPIYTIDLSMGYLFQKKLYFAYPYIKMNIGNGVSDSVSNQVWKYGIELGGEIPARNSLSVFVELNLDIYRIWNLNSRTIENRKDTGLMIGILQKL